MIDTAAVARRVMSLLLAPVCRRELEDGFLPLGDVQGWTSYFCGLHDLGKYSPGFQGLHADLAEQRLGTLAASDVRFVARQPRLRRVDTPHGVVTALHVKRMLESWGTRPEVAEEIAAALGGHHGFFPSSAVVREARRQKNNHGMDKWHAWREGLSLEVAHLLGLPDPRTLPWGEVTIGIGAAVGLAALTTVSDWIASDDSSFPSPSEPLDLAAYAIVAEQRAVAAMAKAGLDTWTPPDNTSFTAMFPAMGEPFPMQKAVERLVAGQREPVLIVVEAPTGEGKSKTALQAAATLVRNLDLGGLYVGMPTQATSNQMLSEVEALFVALADDTTVRLIHSNAQEYLASRATTPTDIGHDDPEDSDVAAQEWFTRKKSLLTNVGIGTVDQALKAVIRSGHMFVRLAALSNKVVIIDEVHAYDTYMSTLLDRLLMWLGRLGVSVVLLSATLPSRRREQFVAAWQAGMTRRDSRVALPQPSSDAYPRVTIADARQVVVEAVDASPLNSDRKLRLVTFKDDELVDRLLDRVRERGSAAVVHNLVARAVCTYKALLERVETLPKAQRPELVLLTGQLTSGQRRYRERWLAAAFGPGGTRPRAIVVGTQVLEQSLDLDFDFLISDAAPIDSLIQRAGREHRHNRDASRGELVLGIVGVVDTAAGPVFPRYLRTIYSQWVLLRTWALLRDKKTISCPDEVLTLVNAVYGEADAIACPVGWEIAWQNAEAEHHRRITRSESQAQTMYLPMPDDATTLPKLSQQPKSSQRTRNGRRKT